MNVLIGCEYSGVVRDAFSRKGHNSWSCDLLPTESVGNHYQIDVMEAILRQKWDIIILHPPCTKVAVSGNRWYGKGTERYNEREWAVRWTQKLWNLATSVCDKVALENPVGVLNALGNFPAPQYIQPWQFGHGETKKTGLWLSGLPELKPTKVVEGREQRIWKMPPSEDRGKLRSITYKGIADAMANQWG